MSEKVIQMEDRLIRSAQDLAVFKLAFAVSLEIHRVSLEFPKIEQYVLADQMRRASRSICANISEGFVKQVSSPAEFGRFLSMAIGSAAEMETWLLYAAALGYISHENKEKWLDNYDHIRKMLVKLKVSLDK